MAISDFFRGKTAIITGASSGIGRDLAILWSVWGCNLGLVARREDRLEETAAQCRKNGADVLVFAGDVTDKASMQAIRDKALGHWGFVDIVVVFGI